MTLLPATTGEPARVLVWGFREDRPNNYETTWWSVIVPENNDRFPTPIQQWDSTQPRRNRMFCAAQSWTAEGRLMVFGGQAGPGPYGTITTHEYTPSPNFPYLGTWRRTADLAKERWYPGVERLGEQPSTVAGDRLMIAGGTARPETLNTYEVFRPDFNHPSGGVFDKWGTGGTAAEQQYAGPNQGSETHLYELGEYARLHLLANTGRVFLAGPNENGTPFRSSRMLHDSLDPSPTWSPIDSIACLPRKQGCSVRMPRPYSATPDDKVMVFGGGFPPTNSTQFCFPDRNMAGSWTTGGFDWAFGPPMLTFRTQHDTVILPTAEVLAVGGYDGSVDVKWGELLRPDGWVPTPSAMSRRAYHSTAVLLPSGRVLVGGANVREWDYEIYDPWYMTGHMRPVISGVPATMDVGSSATYQIDHNPMDQVAISKVVLLRPGTCTHGHDFGQRYVELQKVEVSTHYLTVRAPASDELAPRGPYMLFLVDVFNVPSVAAWVNLL